jgi:hypothetical protein
MLIKNQIVYNIFVNVLYFKNQNKIDTQKIKNKTDEIYSIEFVLI